jgi:outer membrane lipoprotein-sorting protein
MSPLRSRRARYLAPVAVLGAIAIGAWAPTLSASPNPGLAAISPQQLLVDVQSAQPPQLSGTLNWTANLGIADLSSLVQAGGQSGGNGFNPLSLLSGSYNINLWLDGAKAEHIALAQEQPASEVDLVRNGDRAWLWDSSTQTVNEFVGLSTLGGQTTTTTTAPALTPQQVASRLLDHLSPTTQVVTGPSVYVAGQAAYPLVLSPKTSSSTVDHVEVDVGANGTLLGVPLGVRVYASGQTSPALSMAFTRLSLGAPAASELTFTPPPGAKVVTHTLSGSRTSVSSQQGLTVHGSGWATVISGSAARLGASAQGTLDAVTRVVTVGGQQGRLFSTDLLNVLFMNGQFYAGFVTPGVLEAAASSAS